jgi:hypothetical protein
MEIFNPDSKKYPLLKQGFNKEINRLVKSTDRNGTELNVVMLMCPAYPHDGKRYVYDGGTMTGGLTPVTPVFQRETDKLVGALHQRGFPQDKITLLPTICEIEGDLPNVISRFAEGNEVRFSQCVESTASVTGEYFRSRYPGLKIQSGTFVQLMPTLSEDRKYVDGQMEYLCGTGTIPEVLVRQMEFVAANRNNMFTKLYGAREYADFIALARRQMQNYLAVMRGLTQSFPSGSIVLNMQTPNSVYVCQPESMLRGILQIRPDRQLPNFYFF